VAGAHVVYWVHEKGADLVFADDGGVAGSPP
jgi:hypothetical protein